MKNIVEYINESAKSEKYGTLLQHVDINIKDSEDKIKKALTDAIEESISKYKVIRVSAVEEANKKALEKVAANKEQTLKKAEQEIIKLMQSKPGILKRSPEKRQQWVDDKLKKEAEAFDNSRFNRPWLSKPEFADDDVEWGWHQDIHLDHSYRVFHGMKKIEDIIDDICKYINFGVDGRDEDWGHIQSIEFATRSFISQWPRIDIVPVFDDETEKKLADSVRDFGEYMSREYASGRYMGD